MMTSKTRSKALSSLARWTANLLPDEAADELDTLRFLIASEPIDAVGDGEPDAVGDHELERFLTEEPPERVRAVLAEGPLRVAPPRSSTLVALALGEGLARSALRAVTLGPFRDRAGILRWFDLYRPAVRLQVFEAGDPMPALLLTSARVSRFGTLAIDLEAGTVWIRAEKLDPGAPADLYVSVRVRDGKLTLSGAFAESGGAVTLPGALAGQLEMVLEPAAGASSCGAPTVELPERVLVRWSPGGVSGEIIGGSVTAFGARYELRGAARFAVDGTFGTIVAETRAVPGEIDASGVKSSLGRLEGHARIASGGFVLPGFTTSSPALLPEADAGGLYFMRSDTPLSATVRAGGEFSLGPTLWAFATDAFHVIAQEARRSAGDGRQARLRLYRLQGSTHRLALALDTAGPGQFGLGWRDDGGTCAHTVLFTAVAVPAFDRPLDIVGRPVALLPTRLTVMLEQRASVVSATVLGTTWTPVPLSLAIENAVLRVSRTRLLGLSGTLRGHDDLRDGSVYLDFDLAGWVPTQPDPYISNVRPALLQSEGQLRVRGQLAWQADGPALLGFEGALGAAAVRPAPETPPALPGQEHEQRTWELPSQTREGQKTRSEKEQQELQRARDSMVHVLRRQAGRAEERNRELRESLRKVLDDATPRVSGPLFLDVSTNRHLIGVQLGVRLRDGISSMPTDTAGLRMASMRVMSPLSNVRVFTVPQVQWEPVRTLDRDQDSVTLGLFPTPLASRDDGGATVIGARSSRLAAVIPDLALTDMLEEQHRGLPMAVATTLPFGLAATITLRTPSDPGPPDRAELIRPKFDHGHLLEGAHQLSLVAGGPTFVGGPSPVFRGRTAQLLNGVDPASGTPLGISVLGSTLQPASAVEAMFNREFSDQVPRVPVTRLDLSGYGASTFSDWTNPQGAFAEATKVQFRLLVGRTALEIVKFASILYPWGIRVTRAVTIERKGGGGVIRRDTGWQASGPGLFDFRYLEAIGDPPTGYTPRPNPFTFHPGLVQALHHVSRIRSASEATVSLPGGGLVAPVFFDADVSLDGVPGGVTRSQGLLGFLHLSPVGRILSGADLVALLRSEGGAGGPIDAPIDVAASGFKMRGLRIEAVPTADASAIVCAVRGAPELRASGAWSAVRMPGPSAVGSPLEAEPIYDGVPLIQAGRARVLGPSDPAGDRVQRVPGSIGPYRFAEPEDLLRATAPASDIAFLQATPTHSFVFRRPFISPGSGRIESTLPPALADFFARTAFRTPFPAIDAAIVLSDRTYALRLGAGGSFRLDPSVSLPSPRPELLLSSGPDANRRLFYDETTIEFSFDESQWSLSMPRLRMWSDMPAMSQLIGMRMSLVGGSATRPQLRDVESLYHDALATALTFLPGFADRAPIGPIDLAASNLKLQWKVGAVFAFKIKIVPDVLELKLYGGFDFTGVQDDKVPPPLPAGAGPVVVSGGGGFDYGTFGLKAGLELRGKTPTSPWFAVFGVLAEVGGKFFIGDKSSALIPEADRHDKLILTFKIFAGVGYGANVGPFQANIFVGAGPVFIVEGGTFKRGGLLLFEAKAGVSGIVKIRMFAEFQCLFFTKTLPAGLKDYVQFSGELGINIEIFFFSIKLSVTVIGDEEI